MKNFEINEMSDSSVLALSDIRDQIEIDPDYQRPGGVWSKKKKQLFIDSLLNGYDIPKLYFHRLRGDFIKPNYEYAIIDGRQRLEAVWEFIDGKFALDEDFVYFDNEKLDAAGMTFSEIQDEYPRLLIKFHARSLTIMLVTTDDLDFIEDMFSRLNEAVPLNAAEKRNAYGGPLPKIIKAVAGHKFFKSKVKFPDTRYRHFDVATKLLLQEHSESIVDTKRARLDDFVESSKEKKESDFSTTKAGTEETLSAMCSIFEDKDTLLRSNGMAVVYYVLFARNDKAKIQRQKLIRFEDKRANNRVKFENDQKGVNYRWIEYDELAQSSNDASAIGARVRILEEFLGLADAES